MSFIAKHVYNQILRGSSCDITDALRSAGYRKNKTKLQFTKITLFQNEYVNKLASYETKCKIV